MTFVVFISQNVEKRKESWVTDSNPNVFKKDCPEESVETVKGKTLRSVHIISVLSF